MTASSQGELSEAAVSPDVSDDRAADSRGPARAPRSPSDKTEGRASRREGPGAAERRERQRQEARRTILDATEALMLEHQGSDFSIRALGKRSGYSAPTVYHYFGDKDGLIEALLEERVSRLAEQLEGVEPSGDAQADLRAMLLAYFDFSTRNPTFTRLMWTLSRKGESREPEAMERVRNVIQSAMQRFGDSGRLGEFEAGSAGQMLWALAYGLVSLHIAQPDFEMDDRLAARAFDALFLGMAELENSSK